MKSRKIINVVFAIILFAFAILIINSITFIKNFNIEDENTNKYEMIYGSTLEETIYNFLMEETNSYLNGEFKTASYIVLDEEEYEIKNNEMESVKNTCYVEYLLTMVGNYGFENGVFTKVSGSGVIPMVMQIEKESDAYYKLINVQIPKDGSMYTSSIKEMFPISLHNKVFDTLEAYENLKIESENKAREYLKTINRDAQVLDYVEKELGNINTNISNDLLDIFYEYPYWNGTLERLENQTRYVYEKNIEEVEDYHIVTFSKYEYQNENNIIEKYSYKVTNDKLECINYISQFDKSSNKETLNNYIINEIKEAHSLIYDNVKVYLELKEFKEIDDELEARYNVKVTYNFKNYDKDESEIPYLVELKNQNSSAYDVMKEEYKKMQESNSYIRAKVKLDERYKRLIYRNLSNILESENAVILENDIGIKTEKWANYYDILNHLKDVNNYLKTSNDYDESYQELYK